MREKRMGEDIWNDKVEWRLEIGKHITNMMVFLDFFCKTQKLHKDHVGSPLHDSKERVGGNKFYALKHFFCHWFMF